LIGAIDDLLGCATARQPLTTAGKTGAYLVERVLIDGQRYVVKHLSAGGDWLMRSTGDFGLRELALSERGVFAGLPAEIDHAVVAVARDGRHGVLLMHDEFESQRAESQRGGDSPLPAIIGAGWQRFWSRGGQSVDLVRALLEDPTPLVRRIGATPATLLHGDVKIANLGCGPDGRTIMLDWAPADPGPPWADLAWYLSLNSARLPESKAAVIDRYRGALERHGIDTSPWWDSQLALSLLGSVLQMGWEKALGDDDEFAWWDGHAAEAARHL
jgi:Phosphotransferase enzyme family